MDCSEYRQDWDLWREAMLDEHRSRALRAHRDACRQCRAWEMETRRLVTALAELPEPPVPEGLAERGFARVRARVRRTSAVTSGLAAAALLALGIAIGTLIQRPAPEAGAVVRMPLQQTETVTLALGAPRDMENVRFTVVLPDGVELDGYPGIRRLSWKGRLTKGRNALPLPLRVRRGDGGELVARIERGELVRELRVRVRVTSGAEAQEARERTG